MTRREVALAGLRFYARHGALPHERRQGQPFLVDLDVGYDFARAARTDRLGDALDYRCLYDDVRQVVERGEPFRLIEAMAETIGRSILEAHPEVHSVRVRVAKPWAPLGGDGLGASALYESTREAPKSP